MLLQLVAVVAHQVPVHSFTALHLTWKGAVGVPSTGTFLADAGTQKPKRGSSLACNIVSSPQDALCLSDSRQCPKRRHASDGGATKALSPNCCRCTTNSTRSIMNDNVSGIFRCFQGFFRRLPPKDNFFIDATHRILVEHKNLHHLCQTRSYSSWGWPLITSLRGVSHYVRERTKTGLLQNDASHSRTFVRA